MPWSHRLGRASGPASAAAGPIGVLTARAGLDETGAEVLGLLCAVELDVRRQLLVAYLQDDVTRRRPTLHTLRSLFDAAGALAVAHDAPLRRAHLVDVTGDGPWADRVVAVHPTVVWALVGDRSPDPDLPLRATTASAVDDDASGAWLTVVSGNGPDAPAPSGGVRHRGDRVPRHPPAGGRPPVGGRDPRGDPGWVRRRGGGGGRPTRRRPPRHRANRPPAVVDLLEGRPAPRQPAASTMAPGPGQRGASRRRRVGRRPRERRRPASRARRRAAPAGGIGVRGGRLRPRCRRAALGEWPHRPPRPPDPARARPGTTSSSPTTRSSSCARSWPATATRTSCTGGGGSGHRRRPAWSRCSPDRRGRARRWPPRSSPATWRSTCSSSTCRRS